MLHARLEAPSPKVTIALDKRELELLLDTLETLVAWDEDIGMDREARELRVLFHKLNAYHVGTSGANNG